MARITIEEVYRGEKYGVMSAAMAEYLKDGRPSEYNERTWVDMLLVKHTLVVSNLGQESLLKCFRSLPKHKTENAIRLNQITGSALSLSKIS